MVSDVGLGERVVVGEEAAFTVGPSASRGSEPPVCWGQGTPGFPSTCGQSSLWPTTSWDSSSPTFPLREPSVLGSQAQLAHLQEEEAGPERGSDWPQVTQPAYGSGKAGIWLFKPGLLPLGWSLGMSSTRGKSSRSSQHFPDAEALKAGPAAVAAALRTTPGECGAPSGAAPVGTISHHCLIR